MNNECVLSCERIHKNYRMGKAILRVLRGASLNVGRGEFLAITGASGCGKSTLLHIMGALDVPTEGRVSFCGRNLFESAPRGRAHYRNRDVGFVFQFYHLLPELNVLENVLVPRFVRHRAFQWPTARALARRRAEELLENVGLGERLRHRPNELSGGERQRVAIARSLMNEPALLLADEPTGNLDKKTGTGILDLLAELNEAGQSIVMVTHDNQVAMSAHRRVVLADGVIQET